MEFGRQEEDKRVGIHRAVTQCQVSVLTDKRAKYQDNILTFFSPSSNFQKIDGYQHMLSEGREKEYGMGALA